MSNAMPLSIVVDSREQMPFGFTGSNCYEGVTVSRGSLTTGDYSLEGLESFVAVERKSLPDLVMCLGKERERFVRELERGRALQAFLVIIESDLHELVHGQYRSLLNPHSACQSVAAFMARMRIPFFFAGGRNAAEYMTFSFLKQYAEGERKKLKAIEQALGVQPKRRKEQQSA